MKDSYECGGGSGLCGADAVGGGVNCEIVITKDRTVGQAAEHGDLADVMEGVGDGALEESLGIAVKRFGGGQVVVKIFDGRVETIDLGVPWQRRRVVPGLPALRDGERPVKHIAQMREDLRGRARLVANMEAGEVRRNAAQNFATAVGNGSNGVAKKLPCTIGIVGHRSCSSGLAESNYCVV